MESQPVLYPHEVLAFLFNQCGLAIPATDVRAYWQHARSMGEPWSLETTASNYHIPCGLYGDAARLSTVYAAEKIVGVFLNLPLFRPKSVRASRWLLWSCSAFKVYSNRTFNKVFRVLCWSLNFAYQGSYPTHTLQGTPLGTPEAGKALTSDNLSFAVTELRGDWEWRKLVWRFKNCNWKARTPCFRCPCLASSPNNPGLLYHTVDESAASWSCLNNCVFFFSFGAFARFAKMIQYVLVVCTSHASTLFKQGMAGPRVFQGAIHCAKAEGQEHLQLASTKGGRLALLHLHILEH